MKRIAIFLGGLLTLPVFAEVAPVYFDDDVVYSDADYEDTDLVSEDVVADENVVNKPRVVSKSTGVRPVAASRVTASRVVPSSAATKSVSGRASAGAASRVVAARATSNNNNVSPRSGAARNVAARTATTGAVTTRGSVAPTRSGAAAGAATRATGGAVKTRSSSTRGAVSNAATRARSARSVGTTAVNTARVGVSGNVGVGRRASTIRASAVTVAAAPVSTTETVSNLDELAQLTDYCKAQYANCMDGYCNVLDDSQGRCSCSENLKNYSKVEATLKTVTSELQDVAQKIQYIGLSANEISTLFSETEAEYKMSHDYSSGDETTLKKDLDKIKNMIIDVRSGSATSSAEMQFDISGLLDVSFDSGEYGDSLNFGDFLNGFGVGSSTSSIKNQRGKQLYDTAVGRCKKSVLESCVAQGVDAAVVTNSYDLEIDKECVAYERSLKDENERMSRTVRNAKNVLQKARLLVSQQKNVYDMRGCVTELNNCMQDEFVCGQDYEKCLDPTGRYIVDGAIVIGSQPGQAIDPNQSLDRAANSDVCKVNLYRTWDFGSNSCSGNYGYRENQGNAWGTGPEDTLAKYIETTVTASAAKSSSVIMSEYLQNKIGYIEDNTSYGMCASVLNKCQNYTYNDAGSSNARYNPQNDVIKHYLSRILVQIKAKQDEILSSYAENCISDVTSCLSQNNYPTDTTSVNTVQQRIAINACRSNIITCMSVNGYSTENPTPTQLANWVYGILGQMPETEENEGQTINLPGYVQSTNVFYINYSCGTGSTVGNTDATVVNASSTDAVTLRSNACVQQPGYTCKRYVQGTDTEITDDTINDYAGTYGRNITIEYRCTENLLATVIYDCGTGSTANEDVEATHQVTAPNPRFTIRNRCTAATGYTCKYKYNGVVKNVGNVVNYVQDQNVINYVCTEASYAAPSSNAGTNVNNGSANASSTFQP
ncbi:MAG: hypothetical protein K5912_04070 [Alphaproteobacteria bacterium]|nr:hypothetical protein [Alphaproteobacteria bacterium]